MKRFITIALAVAVLFSFAACQQGMAYREIEYITVAQVKDIIEGQTPSEDAFEVTVHYIDGNTDVYPGTGRVDLETAPREASASIAGHSDSIEIVTIPAEAMTVTVSTENVNRVNKPLEEVLKTGEVSVKVDSVTVTAGDAAWTLSAEELGNASASPVVLEKAERIAVGAYEKETTVTFKAGDVDLKVTVPVTVNVVYGADDPQNPDYVEPDDGKVAISKAEVTKMRVVWYVDGKETSETSTNSLTAHVGQTVTWKLVGEKATMGEKDLPYEMQTGDYEILSNDIPTATLTAANITDDEQKAYTATFRFIADNDIDAPNYGAGSVPELTVTLTVTDYLEKPANPVFYYQKTGEVSSTITAGTEVTLTPSDFTATVKTADGKDVNLVGKTIKDWTKTGTDLKAGDTVTVNFIWEIASGQDPDYATQYGYTGLGKVVINVVASTVSGEDGDKTLITIEN